jgi:hypothetical protein
MKAFIVTYQNGQFIEKGTKKRLIPISSKEFTISGSDDSFAYEDSRLALNPPLNEKDKASWAEKEFGQDNYKKILNAGEVLIFRIGLARTYEGLNGRQFYLTCTLLEDLFLFISKNGDGGNPKDWRLAPCQCELTECKYGGLTITEKIKAESLNSLFSQTVMLYFNLMRSGSTNVFTTFYLDPSPKEFKIRAIQEHEYTNLDSIRHEISKQLA